MLQHPLELAVVVTTFWLVAPVELSALRAQETPPCLAAATLESLALPIEQYEGTSYYFLANGPLRFTIDVSPLENHVLDLLWGSKNDSRTAEMVINGQRLLVEAGGYNGFRWQRVELPQVVGSSGYQITLGPGSGKAGFISAVRLVTKETPLESAIDLPSGQHHIAFELPELQDGWPAVESYAHLPVLERNAFDARRALLQSRRFMEAWLAKADPQSGLIPENLEAGLDHWNGRNNAADNYPFMVLTAALTDRPTFEGRLLEMLRSEQRLTSRVDRLGDYYKFSTRTFEFPAVDMDRIIFDNSEYIKDGLLPLTEWLGPSPWSERMAGIVDDLWAHAAVDTAGGKIPSTNAEVNGDLMQVTSRYFWMTGDRKYLDYVTRIADYYLLGDRHPTRHSDSLKLRDHGCELISGLTEVYFACSHARKEKQQQYREPLHRMLDDILEHGLNEHGMMYNSINPQTGEVIHGGWSDNWGYNYNGFYTVYLVDGTEKYRDAVRHALSNLHHYEGYAWEGKSHDGYADSIESAINLYNREPVDVAAQWMDSQMRIMLAMQRPDGIIGGWHGDGNFARTAIMYALWKQQGVTVQPWREDVRLGAVREEGVLKLQLTTEQPWTGRLVFDPPRHRTVLHLPQDYPRINEFPEWFTVDAERTYRVSGAGDTPQSCSGALLLAGLPVHVQTAHQPLLITLE
ncbi:MAG: hypothetical protein ACYC0X_09405 [Pirellulaceae bacterium]